MSNARKADRPILFSDAMVKGLLREAEHPGAGKRQTRRLLTPMNVTMMGGGGLSGDPITTYRPSREHLREALLHAKGMRTIEHVMTWHQDASDFEGATFVRRIWMASVSPCVADRLWVRETWAVGACAEGLAPAELHPGFWSGERSDNGGLWYRAGGEPSHPVTPRGVWRAPIHMPRWASRLTLTVTDVRVQRLQDMEGQHPSESDAIAEGIRAIHHGDGAYYYSAFRDDPHPKNWRDPTDAFRELWDSLNGKRAGAAWNDNPWVVALTFSVALRNIDAPVPSAEVAA